MLIVTPAASVALVSLLDSPQVPDGAVVRLAQQLDPSGQPAIGLTIANHVEASDEMIDAGLGVDLFVERDAADALDDQQLDVETDGERISFSLQRQSLNGGPAERPADGGA
jgi:Fe-S cluster assembly iron-binding protein IscA